MWCHSSKHVSGMLRLHQFIVAFVSGKDTIDGYNLAIRYL